MLFRYACCFTGLLALSALSATAADNEPPAGFTSLFNGKDLSGWHGVSTEDPRKIQAMSDEDRTTKRTKSLDDIKQHWSVQDADLVNDGFGLYLTTDKDYDHYELWIDYKTVPKADSGIYLKGAPQVQIWDATKGDPRGLGQDKGSGGLWNNTKGAPGKDPSKRMDRPFGEWNSFKIRMIGERVTVVFNGETVVNNAVLENFFANQKAGYVAYGKTGTPKEPGKSEKVPNGFLKDPVPLTGPIQLQNHGTPVFYRNIWIVGK